MSAFFTAAMIETICCRPDLIADHLTRLLTQKRNSLAKLLISNEKNRTYKIQRGCFVDCGETLMLRRSSGG